MRRARLLRSTPFRLALTFGILFIAAFLIAGAVTYELLRRELSRALDMSIRETYSVVASTYVANDLEDLTAAVGTYASLTRSNNRIFLLLAPDGRRVAGNIPAAHFQEGFSTVRATDVGMASDGQFRSFAGNVGPNHLIIGQSYAETNHLERIALVSFAWASVAIVALAVAGGAWLAGRAQRRLDGIEWTMVEVSGGNLTDRIPLRGNGDDIDVVATHMNHALDRLSGLVEGMRQVSTDIAHDLKTPLNRLKMTVEQAIQQSESGQETLALLLEARAEADHINATFEALLRVSQIEAGARKTRFKRVDLSAIVASVAEIYGDVALDNGQSIQFDPASGPSQWINGDPELLTQMFVNIVENAITHCPAGTVIAIGSRMDDCTPRAVVADNGPGIPPEERELVFQRLYRLDKSRTTPGSGVGLSLVKAIAELHGAIVLLQDNQPGLSVVVQFSVSDGHAAANTESVF